MYLVASLNNHSQKCIKSAEAIYCYELDGPHFGFLDILINESNHKKICFSDLSTSYMHPKNTLLSDHSSFLAGSFAFQIDEIEVFTKQ